MSLLSDLLKQRVLFCDGAMGTALHSLSLPADCWMGRENCSEVLALSYPDALRTVHEDYLRAGADIIETNTFGANRAVLSEFQLSSQVLEINRRAAQIARNACQLFSSSEKPRLVAGSLGPGTKLPSLGHIDFDTLTDSYLEQIIGLLEGGVDLILIETCQDILQTKAALLAAERAFASQHVRLPIVTQVTVESNGTMLLGTDIGAAMHILECFDIEVIGINCATGPQEMSDHVSYLGRHCRKFLSVMPNAGLPCISEGRTVYPLPAEEFARWLLRFVEEDGINLVGGCCGTTAEHIAAAVRVIGCRKPLQRQVSFEPSLTSLYSRIPIRQPASSLLVGERANANGSRRFRELLAREDWDSITSMAREQEAQGSHLLDICTAFVGRDEKRDMGEVVRRLASQVNAPLVLDSTEPEVLEAALKHCGGKCLLNSIHLEDGEHRLSRVLSLCRDYGAAVIALTIDEQGMAKSLARKMEVAHRLFDLATGKYRLPATDLFFDPLTFTVCTGNEEDRLLALHTLDSLEAISKEFPQCHTLLGVSNVSFGLHPPLRKILNSVFLHHAHVRGLTAAIVHSASIVPYFRIPEESRQTAEDLLFDRRRPNYDPLSHFLHLHSSEQTPVQEQSVSLSIPDRLNRHILNGDRQDLDQSISEALVSHGPLEIINEILLPAMKTVGDLFGSGQLQLPFVLQSAETMKAAVSFLSPFLDKTGGPSKGRLVLATVRGDVHDIGKNLCDIILTNNGYTVFNLGIKQPLAHILEEAQKKQADAIGMSGLLVKSVMVMKEYLEEMRRQGIRIPVILGGAALTRRYVETECRAVYDGQVYYAKDAFEGLHLMEQICASIPGSSLPSISTSSAHAVLARSPQRVPSDSSRKTLPPRPLPEEESELLLLPLQPATPPQPPFWGSKLLENIPLKSVLPFLNQTMLFSFHWGYRKAGLSAEAYNRQLQELVLPRYRELIALCEREAILQPCAVYGFFRCQSEADEVLLYPAEGSAPVRFPFARQRRDPGRCLADYFHPVGAGIMDVIALQAVTVGALASTTEQEWFAQGRYSDYLHLHGLAVEVAEATAEYVHRHIRMDWSIISEDDRQMNKLIKLGYRGCRYSFGYPACPRLEDQTLLLDLLGAGRIGLSLGENFQMFPEQSTSALVLHHPQASYFSV